MKNSFYITSVNIGDDTVGLTTKYNEKLVNLYANHNQIAEVNLDYHATYDLVNVHFKYNELSNIDLVTINKFSTVTLLSVIPLSFGGVGIREASAITIFKNIDSSVVFGSTLAYGLGVSGSITLLGIIYVIMKK